MQEWQGYDDYCAADANFYDAPDRMRDDATRFAECSAGLPAGWVRAVSGFWVSVAPEGVRLPDQGWKIHVSSTVDGAAETIATVWTYCLERGVAFKFLRSRDAVVHMNRKYAPRGSSGKVLALYPENDDRLATLLTELGALLHGRPGPYILSDLRIGDGPLHVRFGGFKPRLGLDEQGEPVPLIRRPDGAWVPDLRRPFFAVPDWVELPDVLAGHLAARSAQGLADFPYDVEESLHFSNGGGVYLARERATGRRVVLREARPHAGIDGHGRDAVARLHREDESLRRLAGLSCVPQVYCKIEFGGHHFLALEHIDGETLLNAALERYPLVRGNATGQELADYAGWARDTVHRVAAALRQVHARGVRHGDLHPDNVMLAKDGRLVLLDFEAARDHDDTSPPALVAAGFARAVARPGPDGDWNSLAVLWLYLLLPLVDLDDRDPGKLAELAREVRRLYPGAGTGLPAEVARYLDALGMCGPVRTVGRESVAAGILANATPDRTDRLYPNDPAGLRYGGDTLGYGAAGVLWALHRAGVPVPDGHVDWLVRAATLPRTGGNGLYTGGYGVAVALDVLGRRDAALAALDTARRGPQPTSADLFGGRTGVALSLLHFAEVLGDAGLRNEAVELAERVAPGDRPFGLMRGMSGTALLHLHLYRATGDEVWLDRARAALVSDVDRCVEYHGGLMPRDRSGRHLPNLEEGSAGIAMVMHEYLRWRDGDELRAALPGLRHACLAPFARETGVLRGRAGVVIALAAIGERSAAAGHLPRFGWHALRFGGHTAFPGAHLRRLCMDLATGSAGVLLALASVDDDRPALPFADTRSAVADGPRPVPERR